MDTRLPTGRITQVRGYADMQLRYPADPYDARNRRVSIIVSNQVTDAGTTADAVVTNEPAAAQTAHAAGQPDTKAGHAVAQPDTKAGHEAPAGAGK
jgi:hypothetical protein